MMRINMSTTTRGPAGTGLLVHFPDPPRHPDEMMDGELYVAPDSLSNIKGLRAPDMLIAFDADPEACARRQPRHTAGR